MSDSPSARSSRYLLNILWSWGGVAVTILSAAVVPPVVVRKLGAEVYGIWAIALSLVEYFWLMDFGFRPATVKLTADYKARGNMAKVNEVVNSGILYSLMIGAVVLVLTLGFAGPIAGRFNVEPKLVGDFESLIRIVGVSWALGMAFNMMGAGIEGFQRFDITSRVWMGATALRAVGTLIVVGLGYGLLAMAWVLAAAQAMTYLLLLWEWKRLFPQFRFSPADAKRETMREQLDYGLQVVPGMISSRMLSPGIATITGSILNATAVAYYGLSMRIIEYASDAIGRIGLITSPNASELMALGKKEELRQLGKNGNRYCLTIWLLPAIFLFLYREEFYRAWVHEPVAGNCTPLIPPLLAAYSVSMSQFISASILMGVARYRYYSLSLLAETLVILGGLFLVLPAYGLPGAAVMIACCIMLNRGLNLMLEFCRQFEISPLEYMGAIYPRPLMLGLIAGALLQAARQIPFFAGYNWTSLIVSGIVFAAFYGALALIIVLKPNHRRMLWSMVQRRIPGTGVKSPANL